MTTLDERRQALSDNSKCVFVERREFCQLLVSNRRLQRCDESALGVRALLDLDTGVRYMIEEEHLFGGRAAR